MYDVRHYQVRADLALDLATRSDDSVLRGKYLDLWKSWSELARRAEVRASAVLEASRLAAAQIAHLAALPQTVASKAA